MDVFPTEEEKVALAAVTNAASAPENFHEDAQMYLGERLSKLTLEKEEV